MFKGFFGGDNSEKAAPRAMNIGGTLAGGRSLPSPREFHALAYDAFRRNSVASPAIRLIADNASMVPLQVRDATGQVADESTGGAAGELRRLLSRPNQEQSGSEYMAALYAFRQITGNAFPNAVVVDGRPTELWLARPDLMEIEVNSDGTVKEYRFKTGGRIQQKWIVGAVANGLTAIKHIKTFNPLDAFWGQSPLLAAAGAIDGHNQATTWKNALLENGARPSGALRHESTLNKSEFDRLSNDLRESYEGASNAGRPMLLEGGIEWVEMSRTPREMDFNETKNGDAREIASALGIPPQLLNVQGDSTFANAKLARIRLWQETLMPLIEAVLDDLNGWLVPFFDPTGSEGLKITPDFSGIDAFQQAQVERWKDMDQVNFMTLNEKRRRAGFSDIVGGDVIIMNRAPLDDLDSIGDNNDQNGNGE